MLHFASGTNTESCTLSLTGSSILPPPASKRAASTSLSSCAQNRGVRVGIEARRFEVGRQPHLQHVDFFFRRTESLRVGAAQRHELRIEAVPHRRHRCSSSRMALASRPGMRFEVRQRRHVHDRHARHLGFGHRIEQLAHAGRAILRLLHRQRDEIVVGRIERRGAAGGQFARQLARIDFDQPFAALDRHAHDGAFVVDQIRFGGQADQINIMPGERELGAEQRAVRRAHDQNFVGWP